MGQITIPGKPGITVTPIDRETGPGAGAGTSGNRDIFLGLNAAFNAIASDAIVLGNNAMSAGNVGGTGASGSVIIGSSAGKNLVTGATPTILIGQNAGAKLVSSENNVMIGANNYLAQTSVNTSVVVGNGNFQTMANPTAQQFNVIVGTFIGSSGGAPGNNLQIVNSVILGYLACNQWDQGQVAPNTGNVIIGSTAMSGAGVLSCNSSVYIGSGSGISHSGQPNQNVCVGISTGGAQADPDHNVVVGAASFSGFTGNVVLGATINQNGGSSRCILIGIGCGTNGGFPVNAIDEFIIETVAGGIQGTVLYGKIRAGNVAVGLTNYTGTLGRNFGANAQSRLQIRAGVLPTTAPDDGGFNSQGPGGQAIWTDTTLKASQLTGLQVDGAVSFQSPLTGFAITFDGTYSRLILDPAGVLATGQITMPATAANVRNGAMVYVSTSQTITALTVLANAGQTIQNAPVTLAAGTGFAYIYQLATTTWKRLY